MGISNQVLIMATRVTFIRIEKCKDVDLPVDTSNDIYKLKTGSIKENHLIVSKDCDIYVQKSGKWDSLIQNDKKS